MTEEERAALIWSRVNFWLPVRWEHQGIQYEVTDTTPTGDIEAGGVDVSMEKDGTPGVIAFTNDECYGETPLSAASAKARVYDWV